jgi:hypothetical protein
MINIYLIIIFFILLFLIIYFYKNKNIEKFTGILDIFSSINTPNNTVSNNTVSNNTVSNNTVSNNTVSNNTTDIVNINPPNIIVNNVNNFSRTIKYIYLKKIDNNKYFFYNKNNDVYLTVFQSENNYEKKIIIKDLQNNIIGNLINHIYNKIIIKTSLYKNNINIDFSNNFQTIKIYLTDDDKYFNIIMKDNNYTINLFMENIGKIKYDKDDDLYKIMVYEQYKNYLNLIGIAFILLLNN